MFEATGVIYVKWRIEWATLSRRHYIALSGKYKGLLKAQCAIICWKNMWGICLQMPRMTINQIDDYYICGYTFINTPYLNDLFL
jgi:aspartate carbamoyltransferase regulatory subunit